MTKIAIIGAGLAGLTLANQLKDYAKITLFEKARGVGGRMSTRRAEAYAFDHGAQFFTAKSPEFQAFIQPMMTEGIIQRWDARFVEIHQRKIIIKPQWNADNPHYVGTPSMSAIPKYLSQGLNIHLQTRIQTLKKEGRQWMLEDEQGVFWGKYDWLILTAPAEQTRALLSPAYALYEKIAPINMQACFSLMLGFESPLALQFDAAIVRDENISWISANHTKPQRNSHYSLLIHATNQWADQHLALDSTAIQAYLCAETSEILGCNLTQAHHQALHTWRYANIGKQSGDSYLLCHEDKIGICGDWLIQGRVESAFTSAYHLAKALKQSIPINEFPS